MAKKQTRKSRKSQTTDIAVIGNLQGVGKLLEMLQLQRHNPPDSLTDLVEELMCATVSEHYESKADETYTYCNACGEWEGHTDDCFMPALEAWYNEEPKHKRVEVAHRWVYSFNEPGNEGVAMQVPSDWYRMCVAQFEANEHVVAFAGAPGTGRIVYKLTQVDHSNGIVYGEVVENTIRELMPWEVR